MPQSPRAGSRALTSRRLRAARAAALHAALGASLLLAPGSARAADPRERGLELAREGRCTAALPELERARAERPDDAEASLVAGQCLIRLQRYPEAAAAIEAARAANPGLPGVDVSLAIARYHLDEPEAAREALDRAEARDPDRANVQLYRGLLLLDASERDAGLGALSRARDLDPAYAEPVASFYEGIALAEVDRERARRALERVVEGWPGTSWAEEAGRALERLQPEGPEWWLAGSVGVEYDTNVVLKGSGVDLPDEISDEADWRGVWTLSAGSTVYRDDLWTLGVMGGYYGTRQADITQFDTRYPTASLWLDRKLGADTIARGRYEYGFAWVDEDQYLSEHVFEGSLFQGFGDRGQTRFDLRYTRDDFLFGTFDVPDGPGTPEAACDDGLTTCGPPGLNEASARNRDGWEISAGLLHALPLPDTLGLTGLSARAGYAFSWYDSRGREYSFQQHAFEVGAAATLPWQLRFDAQVGFAYRPYRNPSTYPDHTPTDGTEYALSGTNKREREWNVAASLELPVGEYLGLMLAWRYDDNDSSAAVFDYHRHVVGLHLTGRIGP